jgi:hypothetical protein
MSFQGDEAVVAGGPESNAFITDLTAKALSYWTWMPQHLFHQFYAADARKVLK